MALAPKASITLGSEKFDSHALRVVVDLAPLPAIDSFVATFPAAVSISGAVGDDASLDLDGGEGSETVLQGKIRMLRYGLRYTEVVVAAASAALADLRPATTYRNQSADDVVQALASNADVNVADSSIGLPMAAYVADQRRTAAEHIAWLASLGGAIARVNSDGDLEVNRPTSAMPDIAIKYGRELISCDVRAIPAPAAHRIRTGSGPAGSAMALNALRPSKEALPKGADDPGADAVWQPAAVLRTPAAAASAGAAADLVASSGATRIRAEAFLLPKLRPGTVLDVQDLPGALAGGPWLVTRVTHLLDAQSGGRTFFEGDEASGLDLSALAGAALSAIGGLF
jgi:hypothetical protein